MVIVRTRHCQRCEHDRFVPDEIAGNQHTCRACSRKRFKRQHPVRPCHGCGSRRRRPPRTRYCDRCRPTPAEAHRAAVRRHYDKLKVDPERYAEFLEVKRMNSRLRHGSPPLSAERYAERYGSASGDGSAVKVEAGRLGRLIKDWLDVDPDAMREIATDALDGLNTIKRLERQSGVSYRTLCAIVRGERVRCSLQVADRIATALGTHLDVIYPDAPGVPRA